MMMIKLMDMLVMMMIDGVDEDDHDRVLMIMMMLNHFKRHFVDTVHTL